MRRFFIGSGLAAVLGLGLFFGFSGGSSPGGANPGGRLTRAPRYGGRGWVPSSATAAAPSSLLTGIVSYWKVDTDSTDSLGTNNGTDDGITYSAGKISGAANFNSTADRIAFGPAALSGAFTCAGWVNPVSLASYSAVVTHHGGSLGFYVRASGAVDFYAGADHTGATLGVVVGEYHHIAAVYDGTTLSYFIDGTVDANTFTVSITFNPDLLGSDVSAGFTSSPWLGQLDEWGCWSRALTPTEITTLVNGGSGKTYPF